MTVLIITVLAIAAWLVSSGGGDGRPVRTHGVAGAASSRPARFDRGRVVSALEHGVRKAAALGGAVEAGVMLDPWSEPAVAADPPAGAGRWMRMWSMSKVVTMTALLRSMGWGKKPGDPLSPEAWSALQGAIRRSENCRQRRVVLELQRAAGGTQGARHAVEEVLAMAGARARVSGEVEAPESSCVEYLESQHEIPDPLAPALLLGTSTWRVSDAVRFARALSSGRYGAALSGRAISLMRAPKEPSREVSPGELTAPIDWGAGRALAGFAPAYKAGWGGTQQGAFLAGQIVLLSLPGGERAAVAVVFHPDVQPPSDDPGRTAAPHALELVMESLARELK